MEDLGYQSIDQAELDFIEMKKNIKDQMDESGKLISFNERFSTVSEDLKVENIRKVQDDMTVLSQKNIAEREEEIKRYNELSLKAKGIERDIDYLWDEYSQYKNITEELELMRDTRDKLIRLDDLIPEKDVKGGRQLPFGVTDTTQERNNPNK
jgi:hypothetical protein